MSKNDDSSNALSEATLATGRASRTLALRTKLMLIGISACAVAALILFIAESPQAIEEASSPKAEETALASEVSPTASSVRELPGPPVSTTSEVLNRFDRASARARERADRSGF